MDNEAAKHIDVGQCLNIATQNWELRVTDPQGLRPWHLQIAADIMRGWSPVLQELGPLACENMLQNELYQPMQRLPLDWETSKQQLLSQDGWNLQVGYNHSNNYYYVVGNYQLASSHVEEGMSIACDTGRVVIWRNNQSAAFTTESRWEVAPGQDWRFFKDGLPEEDCKQLPTWVATREPQRTPGECLVQYTKEMQQAGMSLPQAFVFSAADYGYRIQQHDNGLSAWDGSLPLAYCNTRESPWVVAVDVPRTWAFPREKLERLPKPDPEMQL